MLSLRCRWFVVGLVLLAFVGVAMAQESLSDAENAPEENTYLNLRRSEDRTTQRFAERYFNLVRRQEWASESGKSKIMAKYVAHDPDMKWVKLAAVKGSGQNRVEKELTVEISKLSKACQSRVRQIAILQAKLDELAAAEDAAGATGEAGAERTAYGEYGAPMVDERGEQPVDPYTEAGVDERAEFGQRDPRLTAGSARDSAAEPFDPDPLGFGEISFDSTATPPMAGGEASPYRLVPTPLESGLQPNPGLGGPVNRGQWAANYAAFHANLSVTPSEQGEPHIEWGELGDLRALNEAAAANLRDGEPIDPYRSRALEIAQRLPEVNWTARFVGMERAEEASSEARFDLPSLPEPLKIRFLVQPESVRDWAQMPPGQQVRFTGRFDIEQPNEIIVRVGTPEAMDSPPPSAGPPARR